MPVSQKPRGPKREAAGPNPFTPAGTLLYGFFEAAAQRKLGGPTVEEMTRRARTKKPRTRRHVGRYSIKRRTRYGVIADKGDSYAAPCDAAGSKPAERRRRQGAHLHQHPSVVARFANHPTREQIEAVAAPLEARQTGGVKGPVSRALDPLRKIAGETKAERDARIKRERRQASVA